MTKNKQVLGAATRKLSEQQPPGWSMSPTNLETLHREDQPNATPTDYEHTDSDDDSELEFQKFDIQHDEEQELEEEYEIQEIEEQKRTNTTSDDIDLHMSNTEHDDMPKLLEHGYSDDESSTSSEESDAEQEWEEESNTPTGYKQTTITEEKKPRELMNPYLIPAQIRPNN